MRKLLIIGTDIFNASWVKDRWLEQKVSQKKLNKFYTNIADSLWEKEMNEQKKLPRPSPGLTFKVRIANNAIFLRTGEYPDGTLGEIFIDMYKEGAGYKAILGSFSTTISWLLQYGVPLEKLLDKFQYTRFEPAGVVTGDEEIKMCTSILDYVFRRLAITYLKKYELGNVQQEAPIVADSELPSFIEDIVVPEWDMLKGPKPDIETYTANGGIIGFRPVGWKAKEFLDYCRKHAKQETTLHGQYTLDFTDDSIVVFNGEESTSVVEAIERLFLHYYNMPLDLGDL